MPAATEAPVIVKPSIKIGGSPLAVPTMNQLVELTVDSSLDMPTMAVLYFHDDEYTLIDGDVFSLGKAVEVAFLNAQDQGVTIFKGEITALEPYYDEQMNAWLTVRAYDKRHRLNRGSNTRVFLQQKDSEMVSSIAREAGLSATADATTVVYPYVCQHDQTDLEFMRERALLNGYEIDIDGDALKFRLPTAGETIALTRGQQLRTFSPRMSAANQVKSVTVKGWDIKTKQAVIGVASSTTSHPQIGFAKTGGAAAQTAFGSDPKYYEVRYSETQGQAEKLAQSLLNDINSGFIEAEGMAFGEPKIKAGCKVQIQGLGTRYSGTYRVTSATHIYNGDEGYNTRFRIEGTTPKTISELIGGNSEGPGFLSQWTGVVSALVTNNNDPDAMGRVKVKFPWLSDTIESNWARVAAVGAGATRGFWNLPEVNDEVLVAFEQGDFNRPVLLGGLWNGTDATPESIGSTVKGGKVVQRTIKTRLGHIVRFNDDDNENSIEIIDSKQGTTIKLDAKTNKLDITCKGDVTIKSTGKTNVEATGNLDMKSSASVSLKSTGNMNVEATGNLVLKGATVNIN